MPTVETTVWINASLAKVFGIAKDSESYPEYMKDVQSVTPVERDGNRVVADRGGGVPNFMIKLRWRQEEVWDEATHSSHFRQLEGDYDSLDGTWSFREENGGTRFDQHVEYEYNVPTLGPLVKKVIHSIVVKNLENINLAFKKRAETSAE
jgi:ribosome-associated toxin RatA of RatAB toxin-antitoxin module